MEITVEKPTKLFNRNFFLQWQGQSVSRLGAQAFSIAMVLWIKHVTGSATMMGLLVMLSTIPGVILGPIGGALADRYSRRKIIIISDLVCGVAVLSLAIMLFVIPNATNVILVWLFIVSFLVSLIGTFFGPAIMATIPDLVPHEKVTSANSLGQLSAQLSVFIGQGLGATFYRLLGAPILFLLNAFTYLFASTSEVFVTIPQVIPQRKKSNLKTQFINFGKDIREGLRYVWKKVGLREAVLISAILNFFSVPVTFLLPFFVEDFLKVKIDWYGFIMATYGIGTLIGYLVAGALSLSPKKRSRFMMAFTVIDSLGYGLLAFVRNPILAVALAFVGGFAGGFFVVNITTIMQVSTPGEIRGRVFGLLTALSGSLVPIATALAGVAADLLNQNIPLIYFFCGGIMVVVSLIVIFNKNYKNFLAYEFQPVDKLP